jgi:hypothetical protein
MLIVEDYDNEILHTIQQVKKWPGMQSSSLRPIFLFY